MNALELAVRSQDVHIGVAYLLWHQGRLAKLRLLLVLPYGEDSQNSCLCQWLLTSVGSKAPGTDASVGSF